MQKYRLRKLKNETSGLHPFLRQLNLPVDHSSSSNPRRIARQEACSDHLLHVLSKLQFSDDENGEETLNYPVFNTAYVQQVLNTRGIEYNSTEQQQPSSTAGKQTGGVPFEAGGSSNPAHADDYAPVNNNGDLESDDFIDIVNALFPGDDDPPMDSF